MKRRKRHEECTIHGCKRPRARLLGVSFYVVCTPHLKEFETAHKRNDEKASRIMI